MDEPTFDSDGYPTEETLEAIEKWPYDDLNGLILFAKEAFTGGSSYGWFKNEPSKIEPIWRPDYDDEGRTWCCATGGWSGCESVIAALERNTIFWFMCWRASVRGGYFEFRAPEEG